MRRLPANLIGAALLTILGTAGACQEGAPATGERPAAGGGAPGYPAGPWSVAPGAVLPDLRWSGVDASGEPTELALHDYVEPEGSGLLLLQVHGGLWCGTCRWYGAHEGELRSAAWSARVRRLDLVVGSRDDAPAGVADAAAWQRAFSLERPVGADPDFALGGVLAGQGAPLPLFVVVDTRTMRVVEVRSNPAPEELDDAVATALATIDEEEPPEPTEPPLVNGLFTRNEWDLLQETTLPGAPPPDPTNAWADDPAARRLGRALFFDQGLSPSGTVSCATCHQPARGFSDGLARAQGVAPGTRRTPAIALAAHARWQQWDGRADSLWSQALGPLENADEFGSSRLFVVQRLAAAHSADFASAFPDHDLSQAARWPQAGKPGDAAYDALPAADRDAITRLFVDAGKALEAYERSLRVLPNRLDDYLGGDPAALDDLQRYGLQVFVRNGCMQCHWGPRLTDDAFHVTRIPSQGRGPGDRGRAEGLPAWRASEFDGHGRFSDAPAEEEEAAGNDGEVNPSSVLGQFKTPSLRGTADLDHWGHDGAFAGLALVTASYGQGGVPADDPRVLGHREPWLSTFGETAQWALVPFLGTLTATPAGD